MATLNEIVYNITDILEQSNDASFRERVKFTVLYYRALLLRREAERNNYISPEFIQRIPSIAVASCDLSGKAGSGASYPYYRTHELPSPLRLKDRETFHYVGLDNMLSAVSEISADAVRHLSYAKYTSLTPFYLYRNNRIYLKNFTPANPNVITVEAIWEDPTLLEAYTDINGSTTVYSDTTKFPISNDMVQMIAQSILAGEYKIVDKQSEIITINE